MNGSLFTPEEYEWSGRSRSRQRGRQMLPPRAAVGHLARRGRHAPAATRRTGGGTLVGPGGAAEALTDALPPPAPGAMPREVGSWPRGTTMVVPGRDIAPRAAGCCWWGSDPAGDACVHVVEG